MKLLFITYGLASGGAERFLTDMLNELSKKNNVDITLLFLKSGKNPKDSFYLPELNKKVKVEWLGYEKLKLSVVSTLYKYIKSNSPDIVHVHLSPIILLCLKAIVYYRKPIYMETLHNEVARIDNSSKIKRFLKHFVYHRSNVKICTISDKNASEFKRVYDRKCDVLIYNGRKYTPASAQFDARKSEVNCFKRNQETIVFTHIARFSPQKNQNLLIDSFNKLIEQGFNITLLVIGSGFDTPKGLELQAKANKAIHFLGEQHDVQDYLLCSDAFCLSSNYEGMPITLIEAFANGCIPLSTPVSGVTDLVVNGKNGFISADFTLDSYIDMLKRYVANRKKVDKKALIELYNSKLSIEACTESYYKFYKSLYDKSH